MYLLKVLIVKLNQIKQKRNSSSARNNGNTNAMSFLDQWNCCKSTDELSDIAATIKSYTSIHFNHEEWLKIRFALMVYSCCIFTWVLMDVIFSDRTYFFFIYATHWILLLAVMLYLICSYVITLVIHERISSTIGCSAKASMAISKRQQEHHYKHNPFEDMALEQGSGDNIPSLTELGLFRYNLFIVALQNMALAPSILFPIIFWSLIFPNIGDETYGWYEILLEFHIHSVIPILLLFDYLFSSRSVLYTDIYQPLLVGTAYCVWTLFIWNEGDAEHQDSPSYLYAHYYFLESHDFILWVLMNLSALSFVHLVLAFVKTKMLSRHFMTIQLTAKQSIVIDKNGNIVEDKPKKKKKKTEKAKKDKAKKKEKKAKKVKNKKVEKPKTERKKSNEIEVNMTETDHEEIKKDKDEKVAKEEKLSFALDLDDENDSNNAIKQGFRNLISIIEPNQNDVEYTKGVLSPDDTSSSSSESDSDDLESDLNNDSDRVREFYALKRGDESDQLQSADDMSDEHGTFDAIKTKSLATLLNLSKKLTNITFPNGYSKTHKSDIDYSHDESYITSGCESSAQICLKSGWNGR